MCIEEIHVNDPVTREDILVTRGEQMLTFVRYESDSRYFVLDRFGFDTGRTWRGDIEGASDFIALNDLFDTVYDEDDDDSPTYHADDPRSHG